MLRRRLLGTNVGRWDYLGSLIEMWKDDPTASIRIRRSIGMASPNMIAYQRYNALVMLMAGMKNGELTQRGADRRHGGGDDLSGRRSARPLALQPAGAARDGDRQASRTAARA